MRSPAAPLRSPHRPRTTPPAALPQVPGAQDMIPWIAEQSADTLAACLTADPFPALKIGILYQASAMNARLLATLLVVGCRAPDLWMPNGPSPWAQGLSPDVYLAGATAALLRTRRPRRSAPGSAPGSPMGPLRLTEDAQALSLMRLAVTAIARERGTPVPLSGSLRSALMRLVTPLPIGQASPSSTAVTAMRVLLAAGVLPPPRATMPLATWLPCPADLESLIRLPGVTATQIQEAITTLWHEYRVEDRPIYQRVFARAALALVGQSAERRRAVLAVPAGAALWQAALEWGLDPRSVARQLDGVRDESVVFASPAWAWVIALATPESLEAVRPAWLRASESLLAETRAPWTLLARRYLRDGRLSSGDLTRLLMSPSAVTREIAALDLTNAPSEPRLAHRGLAAPTGRFTRRRLT